MACVVMLVIILMSLILGAELGPKADPTTTTYTPRPEWYFFFLFELLRVIKPPSLVSLATIGDPDDLHDPALPAAVLRPRARAPARAPAGGDPGRAVHDRRDGLPDLPGSQRRPADQVDLPTPERVRRGAQRLTEFETGKQVVAQSGCLACHQLGENGNTGPGRR